MPNSLNNGVLGLHTWLLLEGLCRLISAWDFPKSEGIRMLMISKS